MSSLFDAIQPDDGQSINPYSYVMNNPLKYTDPSGYVSQQADKSNLSDEFYEELGDKIAACEGNCNIAVVSASGKVIGIVKVTKSNGAKTSGPSGARSGGSNLDKSSIKTPSSNLSSNKNNISKSKMNQLTKSEASSYSGSTSGANHQVRSMGFEEAQDVVKKAKAQLQRKIWRSKKFKNEDIKDHYITLLAKITVLVDIETGPFDALAEVKANIVTIYKWPLVRRIKANGMDYRSSDRIAVYKISKILAHELRHFSVTNQALPYDPAALIDSSRHDSAPREVDARNFVDKLYNRKNKELIEDY